MAGILIDAAGDILTGHLNGIFTTIIKSFSNAAAQKMLLERNVVSSLAKAAAEIADAGAPVAMRLSPDTDILVQKICTEMEKVTSLWNYFDIAKLVFDHIRNTPDLGDSTKEYSAAAMAAVQGTPVTYNGPPQPVTPTYPIILEEAYRTSFATTLEIVTAYREKIETVRKNTKKTFTDINSIIQTYDATLKAISEFRMLALQYFKDVLFNQ